MNIKLKANDKTILVDGTPFENDVAPVQLNDRTYVPLRCIAELFGYNVNWNENTEEVTIFDRKKYFDTIDECAIDFYMHFNAMSIGIFRELGATVKKCDLGYYWSSVCIGNAKDVPSYKFDFDNAYAILHTHGGAGGASNELSTDDKKLANKKKMPIYMASPVGQCWKYDPNAEVKKEVMFYDGAPTDLRSIKALEKIGYKNLEKNVEKFNQYFPIYHDLKDEPYGHTADYYNKMFAKGEVYVLRVDADE